MPSVVGAASVVVVAVSSRVFGRSPPLRYGSRAEASPRAPSGLGPSGLAR